MSELDQCRANLKSEDLSQRVEAATQLSQAGPDAAVAAVELVQACSDEEQVQLLAVAALEEMGPPPLDSLESLQPLAKDADPLVAYWAITLMGRLGSSADGCQPVLAEVLTESQESSVQQRAAWALEKIGGDCSKAKAALTAAAASSDARLARLAESALQTVPDNKSTS